MNSEETTSNKTAVVLDVCHEANGVIWDTCLADSHDIWTSRPATFLCDGRLEFVFRIIRPVSDREGNTPE